MRTWLYTLVLVAVVFLALAGVADAAPHWFKPHHW